MTAVLVVCTANICRSPMAAALLVHHLEAAGSSTRVHSAGTHALPNDVASDSVAVMADRGIDIAGHSPRLLARDDVHWADVIVTMEAAHVAHVVALDSAAFGKTFCARELVQRAERLGPRRGDETLADYLARLHTGRRAADVLRAASELDISDPIGQSREAFETSAKELDELMEAVAEIVR